MALKLIKLRKRKHKQQPRKVPALLQPKPEPKQPPRLNCLILNVPD